MSETRTAISTATNQAADAAVRARDWLHEFRLPGRVREVGNQVVVELTTTDTSAAFIVDLLAVLRVSPVLAVVRVNRGRLEVVAAYL